MDWRNAGVQRHSDNTSQLCRSAASVMGAAQSKKKACHMRANADMLFITKNN
jgi:hypothetical protein